MKNLILFLTLSFSGCGTIIGTAERGWAPFRGIETDVNKVSDSFSHRNYAMDRILILDMPLSLSLDILILPISTLGAVIENPH